LFGLPKAGALSGLSAYRAQGRHPHRRAGADPGARHHDGAVPQRRLQGRALGRTHHHGWRRMMAKASKRGTRKNNGRGNAGVAKKTRSTAKSTMTKRVKAKSAKFKSAKSKSAKPKSIKLKALDPVTLEVIRNALPAVANEMAADLQRTSYNMMIYEVRDF